MKELIEKAIKLNEELVAKLKELEELEELALLGADGKYFTCEIDGGKTKGRITVEDIGVYLCQDSNKGDSCNDKLGYRYSYFIAKGTEADLEMTDVTNLKLWNYLPKEGEYFYVKPQSTREYIAIAKEGEDITHSYANLNLDSKDFYWSGRVCNDSRIVELRPATPQEIALLDTKLKENGKYFDQTTMSIKDIVKEPAFKVGDKVIVNKPQKVQYPAWVSNMDELHGKTLTVRNIGKEGYLCMNECGWNFHPDWCMKVEAPKPKVGDRCIFWDDNKSNAIIGKLTKINYESYCPYEVADVVSYKNCIKFESMEQYNKFIEE